MRQSEFQTAQESSMENLGRQARLAGFPITACNVSTQNPLRVWWICGWHDTDVELRNQPIQELAA